MFNPLFLIGEIKKVKIFCMVWLVWLADSIIKNLLLLFSICLPNGKSAYQTKKPLTVAIVSGRQILKTNNRRDTK